MNITKHSSRKVLLFTLLLILLAPHPGSGERTKKSVLYLNSYHHGYQWSDSIHDGIRDTLNSSPYKIDLQVEYLDAKRYNNPRSSRVYWKFFSKNTQASISM